MTREDKRPEPQQIAPELISAFSAFNDILIKLYDGPLRFKPDWEECLEAIRQHFLANQAVLIFCIPQPSTPVTRVIINAETPLDQYEHFYADTFFALDPLSHIPRDEAFTAEDFFGKERWTNHVFYRDFLAPMDVCHALAVNMLTSDGIDCRIRITRPKKAPDFSEADKNELNLLIPHLKRCVQLHAQQHEMRSTNQMFETTIDKLMFGSIILDQYGSVLHTNKIADEVIAKKEQLIVTNTKLRARSPESNKQLQNLISEALEARTKNESQVRAMSILDMSTGCPLGIIVRNLCSDSWAEAERHAAIAILFRDPLYTSDTSEVVLRQLFSLTPAESGLAKLLAAGLTLDEAAEKLHISRNTARTHLRSLFWKTGTSRQSDFIRVILSSVASLCEG